MGAVLCSTGGKQIEIDISVMPYDPKNGTKKSDVSVAKAAKFLTEEQTKLVS